MTPEIKTFTISNKPTGLVITQVTDPCEFDPLANCAVIRCTKDNIEAIHKLGNALTQAQRQLGFETVHIEIPADEIADFFLLPKDYIDELKEDELLPVQIEEDEMTAYQAPRCYTYASCYTDAKEMIFISRHKDTNEEARCRVKIEELEKQII